MATAPKHHSRSTIPQPPANHDSVIIHGDRAVLQHWLDHYWRKLALPEQELAALAITQDRQEYMRWTGKRLNLMALGCYCYLQVPGPLRSSMPRLAGEKAPPQLPPSYHHLIFVEPDMQPRSIEVTVAHELIHLADRMHGQPRRHRHHGYDAIALDEAAVTGYAIEDLRVLLYEESSRREQMRRARRPIRYLYECPHCGQQYPRTRKYSHAVSCSSCDKRYNPHFRLQLAQAE
jgi:hypothetical protein